MTSVWYLQDCVRIVLPFANFREPTFEAAWERFQHQALACVACMNIQHLQIRSLVAWCSSIGQQREFKSQKHNSSTLPSQHLEYFDVFSQVRCAWFSVPGSCSSLLGRELGGHSWTREVLEVPDSATAQEKTEFKIQITLRSKSRYKTVQVMQKNLVALMYQPSGFLVSYDQGPKGLPPLGFLTSTHQLGDLEGYRTYPNLETDPCPAGIQQFISFNVLHRLATKVNHLVNLWRGCFRSARD